MKRLPTKRRGAPRPSYLRLVTAEPQPGADTAPAPTPQPQTWTYRGIAFPTPLAANWARAFDARGIAWEYRTRSIDVDGEAVTPDFYLPRSRQYVVVRPSLALDDVDRLRFRRLRHAAWIEASREEGYAEGTPEVVLAVGGGTFRGYDEAETVLTQCAECGGWWFMASWAGWGCRCCGAYDGDGHIGEWLHSPMQGWPHCGRTSEVA